MFCLAIIVEGKQATKEEVLADIAAASGIARDAFLSAYLFEYDGRAGLFTGLYSCTSFDEAIRRIIGGTVTPQRKRKAA